VAVGSIVDDDLLGQDPAKACFQKVFDELIEVHGRPLKVE